LAGMVGWPAGVALLIGFALAALAAVPSRSARGWSLAAFAALAAVVAGAPVSTIALAIGVGALVAGLVCELGWPGVVRPWLDGMAALVLVAAWALAERVHPLFQTSTVEWLDIGVAMLLFGTWFAADTLLRAAAEAAPSESMGFRLSRLLRDWPVAAVVLSLSLTLGALWSFSPVWAGVVALVPLVLFIALYRSLLRHEEIEWATVRALGRLPEAAGASLPGHSLATAQIATKMGELSGCRGRDLEDLEKAALVHDLGRVFCSTRQIRELGFTHADVARWSAELVGGSAALARVGRLVAGAAEPYRVPGAGPDPAIDLRSQILAVACRTQELLASGLSIGHCVDELSVESRYRFAPDVVNLVGSVEIAGGCE